jgi:hypothetical protein
MVFELWIWEKRKIGPRKIAEFKSESTCKKWCDKMLDMNVVTDYAISKVETYYYSGGKL